jgi:peptidoglycan hydrolase CwlO-like protein
MAFNDGRITNLQANQTIISNMKNDVENLNTNMENNNKSIDKLNRNFEKLVNGINQQFEQIFKHFSIPRAPVVNFE